MAKGSHLRNYLEVHSLSSDQVFLSIPYKTFSKFSGWTFNPIWTGGGGGKMAPLRVFAKYLKNGSADLHELNFVTFKTII